ncbi:Uncharacterised protein [uncultured archaeon]|nr:Uncharacterised protein [uncultured archaeon]
MTEITALSSVLYDTCVQIKEIVPTSILLVALIPLLAYAALKLGFGLSRTDLKKHGPLIDRVFLVILLLLALAYFASPALIQFMLGQMAGQPVSC